MPTAIAAAEQFAHLVHLAMHEPSDDALAEVLQATLDTLGGMDDSGVDLSTDGVLLRANSQEVPNAFVGVADFVAQCHGHGLSSVYIERKTTADELLLVARAIGAPPVPGQGETALRAALVGVDRIIPTFSAIPRVQPRPTRSLTPEDWGRVVVSDNRTPTLAFAAVRRHEGTLNELFVRFMHTASRDEVAGLLEQLFLMLGDIIRVDDRSALLEIFEFVADRLDKANDDRLREMYVHFERRITRPMTLEMLCKQVLAGGEMASRAIDVARRIGAPAVEVILDMLTATDSRKERSALFNALLTMRIEASYLRHLMHDQRWFVSRNAVDLAGKGARRELEADVIEMTQHADERVRLAALHGLARMGTPKALITLHNAMHDASAAVRAKAAAALGSLRRTLAMPMVTEALSKERDAGVITALKVALGIHSRPEGDVPHPLVDERRSVLRMTQAP